MTTQAVGNPPATNPSINAPADATFKIDDAKVYVPTMMLKYMSLSQLRMITDYYNNWKQGLKGQLDGINNNFKGKKSKEK